LAVRKIFLNGIKGSLKGNFLLAPSRPLNHILAAIKIKEDDEFGVYSTHRRCEGHVEFDMENRKKMISWET
jgi:hypothetical protein